MDLEDVNDDIEIEGEDEAWDGEALGIEWDESEARSIIRDLGIISAL